ncbi:hypothetical protein L1987_81351 [Smallanthus sonchifolius]|uniref:Uncharacterized protein n=1 Tax=Smallanthus sonchifolius TaxID=185202 RepID=A0ACB8YQC0_9ASTR|nr:hypothetical protein L1987_81351 [Smallanthus sonchifolius]
MKQLANSSPIENKPNGPSYTNKRFSKFWRQKHSIYACLRDREMREDHHEIQTPKKDHLQVSSNRKSKSINAPSKKPHHQQQKSTKMNSSSVFTPITEGDVVLNVSEKDSIEKILSISGAVDADQSIVDIGKTSLNSDHNLVPDNTVALQVAEDLARISPISEAFVFDEDQSSIESYIASLSQHISPSYITNGSVEATPLSSKSPAESTPMSSITTVEMTPPSSTSAITSGVTIQETKSIKLESLVKHLRESMFQVLHSADIDTNHKKLLDALVKMVIEEFCSLHEERGLVVGLFSKKVKLVLLSYLVGLLLVCAGFFLFSDVQSSYQGPTPT